VHGPSKALMTRMYLRQTFLLDQAKGGFKAKQ
jgi:hypothetical protein